MAIQGLNVVSGIVLARALGAEGRGILAAVMVWPTMLAALSGVGLGDACTYYAARWPKARLGAVAAGGAVLAAGASTVAVVVGLLLIPSVLAQHGSQAVGLALLFLLFIPLTNVTAPLMGALNGAGRFAAFHILRVLVILLSAAPLLLLAVIGYLNVGAALVVYLGANVVTLAASAERLRTGGRWTLERSAVRVLWAYGIRAHLSTVPGVLNQRLDQLVIAAFLPAVDLGYYVVAVTLTSLQGLVGSSFAFVMLPAVAGAAGSDQLRYALRRFLGLALGIGTVSGLVLLAVAPWIIRTLFGADFLPALPAARILIVGGVFLSLLAPLGAALKGLGRPLTAGLAEVAGLVLTVVLLVTLLPLLGIVGAAVASLAAYAMTCAWMLWRLAAALRTADQDFS